MKELAGNGGAGRNILILAIGFFVGVILLIIFLIGVMTSVGNTPKREGSASCSANLSAEGKKMFKGKEDLFAKYHKASKQFGVPWQILASVHVQETNLGRTTTEQDKEARKKQTSDTNAIGPMQFMERTWVGWAERILVRFPGANKTEFWGKGDLTDNYQKKIMNPELIKEYGGYGWDGNNDGVANPWDEDDAIMSAANYLKSLAKDNGGDWKKAAALYSGSTKGYDSEVVKRAAKISDGSTLTCTGGGQLSEEVSKHLKNFSIGEAPEKIKAMIERGLYEFDNIDYVMGGDRPPIPQDETHKSRTRGKLDCSSFVKWLYAEYLDIHLPRTASAQQHSNLGYTVSKDQMKPGDLIFLQNTYMPGVSHVGIYIGDGKYLNASSSKNDMEIDDINSSYIKNHWHSVKRYYKETKQPKPSPGPSPKAPKN